MVEITPKQARYLAYIRAYRDGFGISPAESEIADAIGVSPPSANQMMKTLERKGLIRRQPGVPRSIQILVADDSIPPWKGKTITRTIWGWFPDQDVKPQVEKATESKTKVVYRFKITLLQVAPPIWRRIEIGDVTLEKLHEMIQTAMGWSNSHMHQFEIGNVRYCNSRSMMDGFDDFEEIDYRGIRISDLIARHGIKLRLRYEYDFGDSWLHQVILEKEMLSEPGVSYPRCIAGARACPPEDVGGVHGFVHFVEAITNPKHKEHREMMEWHGPFDPEHFDAEQATQRMARGLPTW
jgi:hypothetical protein